MTLSERLREYIAAWIESHEHSDALAEIAQLCRNENWNLATWDIEAGLQIPGQAVDDANSSSDPLAAIRSLSAMATPDGTTILVLQNFHRFTQSAEIVQAIARQIVAGKQNRTFVVVLAPVVQIPVELEKLFVVVEHDLPSRDQLAEIARTIANEEGELPEGSELETVLDATAGPTHYEAEGAFALHRRVLRNPLNIPKTHPFLMLIQNLLSLLKKFLNVCGTRFVQRKTAMIYQLLR